ncbi:MAG: preprotein translocase subunit SecE [Acidobacteriota bacterium]
MIKRFKTFLREVRTEFHKVTWPKQKEVYGTTVVVIVTCFIFGFFLWAVDVIMGRVVTWLYSYLG